MVAFRSDPVPGRIPSRCAEHVSVAVARTMCRVSSRPRAELHLPVHDAERPRAKMSGVRRATWADAAAIVDHRSRGGNALDRDQPGGRPAVGALGPRARVEVADDVCGAVHRRHARRARRRKSAGWPARHARTMTVARWGPVRAAGAAVRWRSAGARARRVLGRRARRAAVVAPGAAARVVFVLLDVPEHLRLAEALVLGDGTEASPRSAAPGSAPEPARARRRGDAGRDDRPSVRRATRCPDPHRETAANSIETLLSKSPADSGRNIGGSGAGRQAWVRRPSRRRR